MEIDFSRRQLHLVAPILLMSAYGLPFMKSLLHFHRCVINAYIFSKEQLGKTNTSYVRRHRLRGLGAGRSVRKMTSASGSDRTPEALQVFEVCWVTRRPQLGPELTPLLRQTLSRVDKPQRLRTQRTFNKLNTLSDIHHFMITSQQESPRKWITIILRVDNCDEASGREHMEGPHDQQTQVDVWIGTLPSTEHSSGMFSNWFLYWQCSVIGEYSNRWVPVF